MTVFGFAVKTKQFFSHPGCGDALCTNGKSPNGGWVAEESFCKVNDYGYMAAQEFIVVND